MALSITSPTSICRESAPAQTQTTPEQALHALCSASSDKERRHSLARQWRDQLVETHCMVPGIAANIKEFDAEIADRAKPGHVSPSSAMSGKDCKAFLTAAFGAPVEIAADVGTCMAWSFDFEGSTFLALWRSSKGLGWEWVNQENLTPDEDARDRRSYGRPMLLSHDKESPEAWHNFCRNLASALPLGPAYAHSLAEAFAVEASTLDPKVRSPSLRC